jgi:DNA-binding transcriptional MerR regulator
MTVPRLYSPATVCQVTGIKPGTLRQWHLRGIFQPEAESIPEIIEISKAFGGRPEDELRDAADRVQRAGRIGSRLYTFADIVRVAIILHLIRMRVSVERAAVIADRCYIIDSGRSSLRFAVSLEPEYDEAADAEMDGLGEKSAIDIGFSHCSSLSEIGKKFQALPEDDPRRKFCHPEVGIVINLDAVTQQIRAKLVSIEASQQT